MKRVLAKSGLPSRGGHSRALAGRWCGDVRVAAAWIAAILVAGVAPPGGAAAQEDTQLGLPVGTPAPDAQVEDLDGNAVSLLEVLGGGPALIEFWASWCEQCELLQPEIDAVQERFGERVKVVAVAVAVSQSVRRVRRHIDRHEPGYTFVYDSKGEAVRAYEALTTSIVVLVDGDGRIVSTGVGPRQGLVEAVEGMLGAGGGSSG